MSYKYFICNKRETSSFAIIKIKVCILFDSCCVGICSAFTLELLVQPMSKLTHVCGKFTYFHNTGHMENLCKHFVHLKYVPTILEQ